MLRKRRFNESNRAFDNLVNTVEMIAKSNRFLTIRRGNYIVVDNGEYLEIFDGNEVDSGNGTYIQYEPFTGRIINHDKRLDISMMSNCLNDWIEDNE